MTSITEENGNGFQFEQIGINFLTQYVEATCDQILASQWREIPEKYFKIYNKATTLSKRKIIVPKQSFLVKQNLFDRLFKKKSVTNSILSDPQSHDLDIETVQRALVFFHAIGELILINNQVCIRPQDLLKVMARFISPKDVREELQQGEDFEVALLHETDIEVLLPGSKRNSKLEMMCQFGVCFKMIETVRSEKIPCYLFPSLTIESGIFSIIILQL